jgi:hypothetical protein
MSVKSCLRQAAACAFVWMIFIAAAPAFAQENTAPEVAPGGVVVVKRGITGEVKEERAERGGAVVKSVTGAPTPQTTLLYLPPAGVRELEDVVHYKIGDTPQLPITVNVRPLAPTLDSAKLYQASFKALFVLFILAVLVESGLALLFRWRPFLDYFDSRSMNALVAFLFSLLLVRLFNLDIASQLIGIYTESKIGLTDWQGWPGSILTAMIIAGGSAGVNRILQSFGFRPTSAQEEPKKPELDNTQAWVAVTLVRDKAVGSAEVLIKNAVAGTISGSSPKRRFFRYFVRDKGRFPQTGGYTVVPGQAYDIAVQAYDADGNKLTPVTRGPFDIAPRAIIDIEVKV